MKDKVLYHEFLLFFFPYTSPPIWFLLYHSWRQSSNSPAPVLQYDFVWNFYRTAGAGGWIWKIWLRRRRRPSSLMHFGEIDEMGRNWWNWWRGMAGKVKKNSHALVSRLRRGVWRRQMKGRGQRASRYLRKNSRREAAWKSFPLSSPAVVLYLHIP